MRCQCRGNRARDPRFEMFPVMASAGHTASSPDVESRAKRAKLDVDAHMLYTRSHVFAAAACVYVHAHGRATTDTFSRRAWKQSVANEGAVCRDAYDRRVMDRIRRAPAKPQDKVAVAVWDPKAELAGLSSVFCASGGCAKGEEYLTSRLGSPEDVSTWVKPLQSASHTLLDGRSLSSILLSFPTDGRLPRPSPTAFWATVSDPPTAHARRVVRD
ncbi:hypothetical protein MRX96_014210 [Rhipicephalus microplus]